MNNIKIYKIVQHPVQPAADQRIADLNLVVEEGEGLFGIEGFHPQRHTGELDGQRVDVQAVDVPEPLLSGLARMDMIEEALAGILSA